MTIATINTNGNERCSLIIITEIFESQKYVNYIITEQISNENDISTPELINSGMIRLYFLNDGFMIEYNNGNGSIETIEKSDVIKLEGKVGFGTCFKSCVHGHMINLSWIEKAVCVYDIPLCLGTFLVGCSGCCLYHNNNSSLCDDN